MARVPYSGGIPSVDPAATAPAVYQDMRPGSGFTAVGRATEALGQGVRDLGTGLLRANEVYDEAAADDALNQFQDRTRKVLYGDPDQTIVGEDGQPRADTGYLGTQGAAALHSRKDVQDRIEEINREITSGLRSQQAARLYTNAAKRYRNSVLTQADSHADAQAKVYYTAVNTATGINALTDIANHAEDPEAVAHNTADLISARVKNLQLAGGADDPNLLRQTIDGAKRDALKAQVQAIAVKQPQRALSIWEKNRDLAGVEYDNVASALRARSEQQQGIGLAQDAIDQATGKAIAEIPAQASAPAVPPSEVTTAAAIHAQESGGREIANSWQIQPDTWKRYAQPGEDINNAADNQAVGQRIVADLWQKARGDPARVAVGYFSGEGNIAPADSPTPWIRDVADANGKTVSSYVEDITKRMGLPAPAMDPHSAEGIAAQKANAYEAILSDRSLPPGVVSSALTTIGQFYQMKEAQRVDQVRQRELAKQQAQDVSLKAENQIIENLTSNKPHVTAEMIGSDPSLLPDAKIRMIKFAAEVAKPDPAAQVSHDTLLNVMERMGLPEDNPLRIDKASQITDVFNAGNLSKADYNFALKQFNSAQSAEGQNLSKVTGDFLAGVKPLIDRSNPLMGRIDQTGHQKFYEFQRYVAHQIDAYREAGKNPWNLLDPDSPDYLGKPGSIARFQTSTQQSAANITSSVLGNAGEAPAVPGAPAPAQGGELPEAPRDMAARVVGTWYRTPAGQTVEWTGDAWKLVK